MLGCLLLELIVTIIKDANTRRLSSSLSQYPGIPQHMSGGWKKARRSSSCTFLGTEKKGFSELELVGKKMSIFYCSFYTLNPKKHCPDQK